eukprot:TRINITY_DN3203_c0_g1::TRINITY_DN3203_c0_g1_i1::g.29694::m.29694 TRINITY_DN3203_c0_g1::TRINITY_DN3203_c0_g1_i1::g.29694  ORF type:complete len:284 (+),score=-5.13 TRINITY_DN3203_c0_g1_i1:114-965(+)
MKRFKNGSPKVVSPKLARRVAEDQGADPTSGESDRCMTRSRVLAKCTSQNRPSRPLRARRPSRRASHANARSSSPFKQPIDLPSIDTPKIQVNIRKRKRKCYMTRQAQVSLRLALAAVEEARALGLPSEEVAAAAQAFGTPASDTDSIYDSMADDTSSFSSSDSLDLKLRRVSLRASPPHYIAPVSGARKLLLRKEVKRCDRRKVGSDTLPFFPLQQGPIENTFQPRPDPMHLMCHPTYPCPSYSSGNLAMDVDSDSEFDSGANIINRKDRTQESEQSSQDDG